MDDSRAVVPRQKRAEAIAKAKLHNGSESRYATRMRPPALMEQPALDTLLCEGNQIACMIHPILGALYITPNWHAITGNTVASASGTQFWSLVHDHQQDKLQQLIIQFTSSRDAIAPVRVQIKSKSGKWRWMEVAFSKITRDEKSGEKLALCIMHDVSAEMQAQTRQHKRTLESELALKARSEFLAHLSHELRTPLNAILGFTQMIDNEVFGPMGNEKYNDYIHNIQESGVTLLSKLNDLFEIAHIDAGSAVLNEEVVNLEDLIRQTMEIYSHKAFAHQVKVKLKPYASNVMVCVDRIKMLKVMINLLSNAIKFNKIGGEVIISVQVTKQKDLAITFSDNGQGISKVELARILDAIAHEEGFVGRERNHIGLGLALAVELIKMHQGAIEVESEHGKGSHFAIVLPHDRVRISKTTKVAAKSLEVA